ncbi:MAG: LLM class flavin-dependent oxidoreductase [Candidatus Lokiarchaeota archaeon]|nr:LLM class flavin-dependent oxidoreductase [Candidatus Lokiarchaeota archaeon]
MVKFSLHHATNFSNLGFGRNEVLKSIKISEELGYDMNSVMCHLNWFPNNAEIFSSWIMASEIAMNTKKPEVGIVVTDVFRTHPVQTALNALHLQRLSENRFVLGLGAGEGANLTNFGIDWERSVSHLEEAVQVIKLLFESSPKNKVNFDGDYFKLDQIFLQFPIEKPPKLWLAAGSPRTLKITAKYADGWIPIGCTPKLYKEQLKMVDSEGRNIEHAYNMMISISKKDPEKSKKLMDVVACVQSCRPEILKSYNLEIPEKVDFIKHFKLPLKNQKSHTSKAMSFAQQNIPQDVRMECVLAGSPDEIISQIDKWVDAGCEHFCLQFFGDYWESLELFANEVIPHFK